MTQSSNVQMSIDINNDAGTDYVYDPLSMPQQGTKTRRLFRLLSLLPGDGSDVVQCQLRAYSVDDTPKYEALSYCWNGAPAQQEAQWRALSGHSRSDRRTPAAGRVTQAYWGLMAVP